MKGAFSDCHPAVEFLFFTAVLLLTMLLRHPLLAAMSLLGALLYALRLEGRKALRFAAVFCLPVVALWTAVNPFFNRRGNTPFLYVGGRPLTVESLVYGLATGLMFAAVLLWFYVYSRVMTTDKFLFLFGRVLPSFTMLLSMALRFVPRYTAQAARIADARRGVGRHIDSGSVRRRVKSGGAILASLTTAALENAIGTADSMNARGYGAAPRTRFSLHRFGTRDRTALTVLGALTLPLTAGLIAGAARAVYYPRLDMPPFTAGASPWHAVWLVIYAGLCCFPAIFDGAEALRWRQLRSNM